METNFTKEQQEAIDDMLRKSDKLDVAVETSKYLEDTLGKVHKITIDYKKKILSKYDKDFKIAQDLVHSLGCVEILCDQIKNIDLIPKKIMKEEIIKCLKTTNLGVEGNLPYDIFQKDAKLAVDELIKINICKLEYNTTDILCLRLYDEEYPKDYNDVMNFRNYCINNEIISYKEYLKNK